MLTTMTVEDFTAAYTNGRVYYDKSFQRRLGAWIRKQENRFLLKLFKGQAHTLIVVANVAACLKYSRARGQTNSVRALEKILEAGYRFISLDGQHRTQTILRYFNNEITLTGTFVDILGETHVLENAYYKDTPAILRAKFVSAVINVSKEANSLYKDLSQHFRDLNSGSATNDQEDRNSYPSPIASMIRAWRDRWRVPLSRVVKSTDVLRMGDDELLVKFTMSLIQSYKTKQFAAQPDLTTETLDRFYTIGNDAAALDSRCSPYDKRELDRAKAVLAIAMMSFEKQTHYKPSQKISSKTAWAVVLASAWAYDNDFIITDYAKFFKAVKTQDDDLIDLGERAFIAAKDAKIQAKQDPKEVSRSHYYHAWPGLPHQRKARDKRQKRLYGRLNKFISTDDLEELGVAEAKDLAA